MTKSNDNMNIVDIGYRIRLEDCYLGHLPSFRVSYKKPEASDQQIELLAVRDTLEIKPHKLYESLKKLSDLEKQYGLIRQDNIDNKGCRIAAIRLRYPYLTTHMHYENGKPYKLFGLCHCYNTKKDSESEGPFVVERSAFNLKNSDADVTVSNLIALDDIKTNEFSLRYKFYNNADLIWSDAKKRNVFKENPLTSEELKNARQHEQKYML